MRRIYLAFLLLPLFGSAQITLDQTDVPVAGDTLFYASDTTTAEISIGMAGPDQVWDFSQLQPEAIFQLIATDPAQDPEAENYPGTNLVITTPELKTFLESRDTAVYLLGGSAALAAAYGVDLVAYDPPQKLYQLPTTFGTSFTDTYVIDATTSGAAILPGVDSFRLVRRATATVLVDAYGTVKTPYNNYEALRQRTETVIVDSVYALIFGVWGPFLDQSNTSVQYDWLAAESKGSLVTAFIDEATGIVEGVEFFLDVANASAPAAAFSFEDQGSGTFTFSDLSGNTPSAWEWTFGDGGSSQEQNPVYTYTIGGDYQVCLTARNFVGADQACQTITVDLLSSAPDPARRIRLKVHPNPAGQYVRIHPEGWEHLDFRFQLFDGRGRLVMQKQFRGQLELDLSRLPGGAYHYFLQANRQDQERWSAGILQVTPK